jgi:hypothetical protein
MRVYANTPVESAALPEHTKVDTPSEAYWSVFWIISVFSLAMLGLCRFSLLLWPAHPTIALLLCTAVFGLIGSKAGSIPVRRLGNLPKPVIFLFHSLGYSLGMIIISSQLDHSFDKFDAILWLLAGSAFAYLMMRWGRAPFDSIPTLRPWR